MKRKNIRFVALVLFILSLVSCSNQLHKKFSYIFFASTTMLEGNYMGDYCEIVIYPKEIRKEIYLKSDNGRIEYNESGNYFNYACFKYGIDSIRMYALRNHRKDTVFISTYYIFNDNRVPEFRVNKFICSGDTINISEIALNMDSIDVGVYTKFRNRILTESWFISQISSFQLLQLRGDSIINQFGTFNFDTIGYQYYKDNFKEIMLLDKKYNIVKNEYLSSSVIKSIQKNMKSGDKLLFYNITYYTQYNYKGTKPARPAEFYIK